MNLLQAIKVYPQYALPHHMLSRLMGKLTHCQNRFWKNFFIRQIIKFYHVNLQEAQHEDLDFYSNFNEFFTRQLKTELRPIDNSPNSLVSPADGIISQAGAIKSGEIIQAKNKSYSSLTLLGGDENRAQQFQNGTFATIYLSPKDYHRLHMPIKGKLKEMIHIPGRLFSVNQTTASGIPNLFARNERVVAIFETDAGSMALVLVGAIFVASIETVWAGVITPPSSVKITVTHYGDEAPVLQKGDEMGRFNMGSTIIVLFEPDKTRLTENMLAGQAIQIGQKIATVTPG